MGNSVDQVSEVSSGSGSTDPATQGAQDMMKSVPQVSKNMDDFLGFAGQDMAMIGQLASKSMGQ